MSTDVDIPEPSGLSDAQEKAAALDAQGESRSVIARACGVSAKTISVWRKSPTYRAEVSRTRQEMTDELDAKTSNVKLKLLEAVDEAIDTLRQALQAEREDGTPEYGTRARAAEALLGKAKFVYDADDAGSAGVAAAAIISVNIGNDGKPQVIEGTALDG